VDYQLEMRPSHEWPDYLTVLHHKLRQFLSLGNKMYCFHCQSMPNPKFYPVTCRHSTFEAYIAITSAGQSPPDGWQWPVLHNDASTTSSRLSNRRLSLKFGEQWTAEKYLPSSFTITPDLQAIAGLEHRRSIHPDTNAQVYIGARVREAAFIKTSNWEYNFTSAIQKILSLVSILALIQLATCFGLQSLSWLFSLLLRSMWLLQHREQGTNLTGHQKRRCKLAPVPDHYLIYNVWKTVYNIHCSIAFGDSYTYVQGTHGHQNYSFIADQLNFSYDAETLLSNKIVQNQVSTFHT
jgi:hypothetical protein